MSSPIWTLAAVVLGALLSFAATTLTESRRVRRERLTRWDEQRLDAYTHYLAAVTHQITISRRVAATIGIGPELPTIELQQAAELLSSGEIDRGLAFQAVAILGESTTVEAGHRLNRSLFQLEWIARQLTPASERSWKEASREFSHARDAFYTCVRHELQVTFPHPTPE